MAETFSIAVTGVAAGNPYQPTGEMTIGDSVCQSAGDEQNAMQLGSAFLVKMPDGSQVWHTFDAERSLPGVSLVLKRLY
jgi:hypothetical protein